jgi:hypothetical protein
VRQIVLTEQQLEQIKESSGPVEVLGPGNQLLGSLTFFSPEELEALARYRQRRGEHQPGVPGERVEEFLRKLHEIDDQKGIDETSAREVLKRLQAGEPL